MDMRKILDAHVHGFAGQGTISQVNVGPDGIELEDRTDILLRTMDANGVEMACLHQGPLAQETPLIQSAVRKHPDRFIGFCCWKGGSTGREAAEFVEKWLSEPEFKGVGEALVKKFLIKGKIDTIAAALKELRIAMDAVRAKKAPILFHTGFAGAPPMGSVPRCPHHHRALGGSLSPL
jgi:predicted TIM-barrel fold metal-dependent hydrolase